MTNILINKLHEFKDHPYQVLDNDEMNNLIESVQQQGIMTPLIVRPLEGTTDEYEIISGHRRFRAAQKAGLTEVPAFIRPVSRDEAAIMVVDSNLHREHLLPSEKAFAYKLKAEALKHQGQRTDLTSEQLAPKLSTELIAEQEGTSKDTVKRYIRLTSLVPELLDLVDEGKIKMRPAVELSYLDEDSQRAVVDEIDLNQCTPSHDQTIRMRKFFTDGKLTPEVVSAIMGEEKPNQREKIVLRGDKVRSLIPKNIPVSQTEDYVVKALEHYSRFLRQRAERDSR